MANQVNITRSFSIPVHELYGYFTDPRLIERWSAPDGMTLKVPLFELRVGGRYRYEHTNADGTYVCEGHIRRFTENEMLRSVDDYIKDPSGKIMGEKISSDVIFKSIGRDSEVTVTSYGFSNPDFAAECERGWEQCFNKLQDLVKDSGLKHARSA